MWNGTLRFGQIAIPVGIVASRVEQAVEFKTLHEPCSTPVTRKSWCPEHGAEVPEEETVRGFEVAPGEFVTVTDEELAALAPESDRTIEISAFLEARRVQAAQVERTYLLGVSEGVGRRPYALLCQVLRDLDRVALCRLVYRGHEWLCAIRAHEERPILLLQRLIFADELVDQGPLEADVAGVKLEAKEIELAKDLVERRTKARPRPALFANAHRARVRQLVDAKLAGGSTVAPKRAIHGPDGTPAADLTSALAKSIRPHKRASTKR